MKNFFIFIFAIALFVSLATAFQFNNKAHANACNFYCSSNNYPGYCLLASQVNNSTFGSLVTGSQYCYCLNSFQTQCIGQKGGCVNAVTYANNNPNFNFNTCSAPTPTPTPTPVPTPDCRAPAGGGTGVCAVPPYIGGFYNSSATNCSWTDTNTGIVYTGDQKSNGCCCLKPTSTTPTPTPTPIPYNPPISQPPVVPPTSGYCYPNSNGIDCNNSNGIAGGNCGGTSVCQRTIGNNCICQ